MGDGVLVLLAKVAGVDVRDGCCGEVPGSSAGGEGIEDESEGVCAEVRWGVLGGGCEVVDEVACEVFNEVWGGYGGLGIENVRDFVGDEGDVVFVDCYGVGECFVDRGCGVDFCL
jgi:hypothetical protein